MINKKGVYARVMLKGVCVATIITHSHGSARVF